MEDIIFQFPTAIISPDIEYYGAHYVHTDGGIHISGWEVTNSYGLSLSEPQWCW